MLDKFWEGIGTDLANKSAGYLLGPSFLFWFGGAAMCVLHTGWGETWIFFTGLQVIQQATLVGIAFLVLVFSTVLMQSVSYSLLLLAEGYWHGLSISWLVQ